MQIMLSWATDDTLINYTYSYLNQPVNYYRDQNISSVYSSPRKLNKIVDDDDNNDKLAILTDGRNNINIIAKSMHETESLNGIIKNNFNTKSTNDDYYNQEKVDLQNDGSGEVEVSTKFLSSEDNDTAHISSSTRKGLFHQVNSYFYRIQYSMTT